MKPLGPDERQRILDRVPSASHEDIDEYERLLVARFATDPDVPPPPRPESARERLSLDAAAPEDPSLVRERRIGELYRKLFPKEPAGGGA